MLSSDQKGAIAESAIVHAAVLLRIGVLKPLTEGVRYDLAFDLDAIAAYCPETELCYLLPSALVAGRRELSLRLDPTRNGQKQGIRWADDYDFTRLDWERIAGP